MQQLADEFISGIPMLQGLPPGPVYLLFQVVAGSLMLMVFVAPFAGIISWVERRIAARIMDRIGPNRVGPQGFLQWLADGVKSLLKEDIVPASADSILFRLAPYLVFVGMFMAFVAIPFTSQVVVANLNVGVFYILAVTSLVVVGILMSGWASNNKFSLLGGMRAAAQIISYEIPAGLAILVVVLMTGSLSLQEIIAAQGALPWQWFIFNNPFAFVSFFILFIASLAEGNRTPFDIPEAESELVSGYSTEYSGMRFVFFYFEEWANLYLIAAVATTLFLGGWQVPVTLREWAAGVSPVWPHLLELGSFMGKALGLVFVIIWLRWTLPRVRIDQLMSLCWQYLIPTGFAATLGTALWMVIFPKGFPLICYVLFAGSLLVIGYFIYRVVFHLRFTKAELQLNPFV